MAKQPVLVPDSEGAGRFLPWVIAVMTFLATLMMAGALATDMAIRGWNTALTGTLTVEIAADPDAEYLLQPVFALRPAKIQYFTPIV